MNARSSAGAIGAKLTSHWTVPVSPRYRAPTPALGREIILEALRGHFGEQPLNGGRQGVDDPLQVGVKQRAAGRQHVVGVDRRPARFGLVIDHGLGERDLGRTGCRRSAPRSCSRAAGSDAAASRPRPSCATSRRAGSGTAPPRHACSRPARSISGPRRGVAPRSARGRTGSHWVSRANASSSNSLAGINPGPAGSARYVRSAGRT